LGGFGGVGQEEIGGLGGEKSGQNAEKELKGKKHEEIETKSTLCQAHLILG